MNLTAAMRSALRALSTNALRSLLTMLGIIIGFSYAGSVWGMLPGQEGVSWQGHLFGAIGGVIAAASGVASNKKDNDQLLAPQRGINHGR